MRGLWARPWSRRRCLSSRVFAPSGIKTSGATIYTVYGGNRNGTHVCASGHSTRAIYRHSEAPTHNTAAVRGHRSGRRPPISRGAWRHLTPKQKRELIEKFLRADPTKSDQQIDRSVKVDSKTVGAVRKRAEAREEIPHVSKRIGSNNVRKAVHSIGQSKI
jgi:hypothetical protein